MYSRTAGYALCIMGHMSNEPARAWRTQEVARLLGLPVPYTAKVLQRLRDGGFVRARRGRRGGFQLAPTASTLSLHGVVQFMDGEGEFGQCLLGRKVCAAESACRLHRFWSQIKSVRDQALRGTSVADLAGESLDRGRNPSRGSTAAGRPSPRKRGAPSPASQAPRRPRPRASIRTPT